MSLSIKKNKRAEVKNIYNKFKKKNNFSDEEFAELLGISRTTLASFLGGKPVRDKIFHKICNQLNITSEEYNEEKLSLDFIKERIEEKSKELAELEKDEFSSEKQRRVRQEIKQLKRELTKYLPLKSNSILPGQTSSRCYQLRERIGDGGFAAVWEAYEINESKDIEKVINVVALKVLYPHHARNEIQRKYFFEGVQNMQKLHHPNIVGIYNIFEPEEGEEETHCYFTMQYINGKNIRESINYLKSYCFYIFVENKYFLIDDQQSISFKVLELC